MPFLVIVQRRVGQVRARIAGETQESLSELTAITQETLSVSGILLSKSFNRQRAESARYQDENRNQVRLQVRRAMSGQGFFAVVQVLMSIGAGRHLPRLGVPHHRRRRRHDHRRHDRRLHDRAGATADAAHGPHARRARPADLGGAVRPHLRVPRPRARDQRRARRRAGVRGARSARARRVPRRRLPLSGCRARRPPDAAGGLVHGRAGSARRLRRAVGRGQDDRAVPDAAHVRGIRRVRCCSRARTCATSRRSRSSTTSASCRRRPTSSTRRSARTCATRSRTRRMPSSRPRAVPRTSTTSSRASSTATTRSWGSAAIGSPAARSSASRSRACC